MGTVVNQRMEDGFLSLTTLQKIYEESRIKYGWAKRDMSNIIHTDAMIERFYEIYQMLSEGNGLSVSQREKFEFLYSTDNQDVIKPSNRGFIDLSYFKSEISKKGAVAFFKELGLWHTKGARENKEVWVDPYLFVSIALEMHAKLYAHTVIWITDSLIFDRKEAGGNYLPMNVAIDKKLGLSDYWKYAILINKNVFGKHEKGIRNFATKEQLRDISKLEEFITTSIEHSLITSEQQLCNVLINFKF
jgi:hypothetical protein